MVKAPFWDILDNTSKPCERKPAKLLPLCMCTGGRELAGHGIEYTPDGRMGPQLGAQFAQFVKELRSEYAGAVTGCAQRIVSVVFSMEPRILTRLQQHGLTGNPAQTAQEVSVSLIAIPTSEGNQLWLLGHVIAPKGF